MTGPPDSTLRARHAPSTSPLRTRSQRASGLPTVSQLGGHMRMSSERDEAQSKGGPSLTSQLVGQGNGALADANSAQMIDIRSVSRNY